MSRSTPIFDDGNHARLADARHKWRWLVLAYCFDLREGDHESGCHLSASHISGSEVELSYLVSPNSGLLPLVISVPLVFCNDDPLILAHERQPHVVFYATFKTVMVAFHSHILVRQGFQYRLASIQVFIEIENKIFKPQLLWFPSG